MKLTVACLQNAAQADPAIGAGEAETLARDAAAKGARLLVLPEFFACLHLDDAGLDVGAAPQESHPQLARFSALAAELKVWLHLGSLGILLPDGKTANRSFLIDDSGGIRATYDKVHLFDVNLSGGESYRESDTIAAGNRAVVAETPWGGIGLSVCYDLRFAALYRALAQAGARILLVPAAFTAKTGEAHWQVLLRARAIENGAFVVAAGQYGRHGRAETYGHSLIIDPWGRILAEGGTGPETVLTELDLSTCEKTRAMIPSLDHDRPFSVFRS